MFGFSYTLFFPSQSQVSCSSCLLFGEPTLYQTRSSDACHPPTNVTSRFISGCPFVRSFLWQHSLGVGKVSVSLARQTTVVAEGASWMAKSKGVPSGLVVVVLVWVLRTLLPSTSSRDRPLGVPGEGFTGGSLMKEAPKSLFPPLKLMNFKNLLAYFSKHS